jgi:SNF family Na+-dependent transporter
MPKEPVEDPDEALVDNILTLLFLLLGVLAAFTSVSVLAYSTAVTISTHELPADLPTLIFTVLLFVAGLGSLHVFRRRRMLKKTKTSRLFWV